MILSLTIVKQTWQRKRENKRGTTGNKICT